MFHIFFGWSKATKCKKAIKSARYKIMLLKNKRQAIVKQLRKDLVVLIQSGYQQAAINRVEQLMKDESLVAAYELLDQICEFILTQLSYIRKHKDCPNDIKEAISSLIFASARCGEIPELSVIRNLFRKRYGENFATTAIELFPGNLVNKQLKENLSWKYVPEDLKYRVVDEIAMDNNCHQQQVLAIEYYPNWQQVQLKEKEYQLVESSAQINASSFDDSSAIVAIAQHYPQYIMRYPKLLSSINHVDDFEECRFSLREKGAFKDEMLLELNSLGVTKGEKTRFGCDESNIGQDESLSESVSKRISRKSKRSPRKRSSSLENLGIVDIGYMIYYQKPCKSPYSHKDHKKSMSKEASLLQHDESTFESQLNVVSKFSLRPCVEHDYLRPSESVKTQMKTKDITRREYFNRKIRGCSLDKPCYILLYDDKDIMKTQSMNPKRVIEPKHVDQDYMDDECCHCRTFCDDELNKGMELITIPQKQEIIASSNVSNPRTNETEVPYLRAMTMPLERQRKGKDKMLRTYSCPSQHPNHVHPKLPNYDDIASKFNALKREHLENKDINR